MNLGPSNPRLKPEPRDHCLFQSGHYLIFQKENSEKPLSQCEQLRDNLSTRGVSSYLHVVSSCDMPCSIMDCSVSLHPGTLLLKVTLFHILLSKQKCTLPDTPSVTLFEMPCREPATCPRILKRHPGLRFWPTMPSSNLV